MKTAKSKIAITCISFFVALLYGNDLFGQSFKQEKRSEAQRMRRLIEEHDREELRGDLAIELTGLEQGENGFRENTPALLYSDRKASIVDKNALYKRKLAMYEKGQLYDTAPVEKDRVTTCSTWVKPRYSKASMSVGATFTGDSSDSTRVWLYAGIPVLVGLFLLMRLRKRRLLHAIEVENNAQRSRFGKTPLR